MKIALVTTTINIPHVLKLYRVTNTDVRFFIALDEKTPAFGALTDEIGNCWTGHGGGWKCSDLIGWNCIQRRNIATLEALDWGADIVVFVDDDNIPLSTNSYFCDFLLDECDTFDGLLASPEIPWFDVGQLYDPPASHRGFPHQFGQCAPRFSFVTDAKIGVHAGLVIGDPDISAITRIARAPTVHRFSEALRHGVAVNPRFTRTVFNTQNTAVIRDLVPAMLLCPQFKRYDDIIASLVCQRVMSVLGYHVLFGPPVVWQERNVHDLSRDLADEVWGQQHLLDVQTAIWSVEYHPARCLIIDIYEKLDELLPGVGELAHAWCEDCERAMA